MKNDSEKGSAFPGKPLDPKREIMFHGIPASPGIAIGIALVVRDSRHVVLEDDGRILSEDEIPNEINNFTAALERTKEQISDLKEHLGSSVEAGIFDAHLLIVDDKMLMQEVVTAIRRERRSAGPVFSEIIRKYIAAISAVNDQYLKERAADVADVADRILGNLNGKERRLLDQLPGLRIVISHDLAPSDTAMLDRENVQAFVTETGSRTSHTAILARSMKIPAAVGIRNITSSIRNGDTIIVDGFLGAAIINPKQETLALYAKKEAFREQLYNELQRENSLQAETVDGYRIKIAANIDNVERLGDIASAGASGIGLFRTEYLFMGGKIPSEEEQFEVYRKTVEAVGGEAAIIRTLDLGGDKLSAQLDFGHEPNPFLGQRSVRLCLAHPELLIPQLRAILRASAYGCIKLMFPMITCEDELDKIHSILDGVRRDLRAEKKSFDESMEIGAMIETPAAALFVDRLAEKCDFFSIGTNDLVQYTMAVDRGNEKVANLYRPSHPVILRLIRQIVEAAERNGIWVSVCGEMASDPRYIPILIGLGVQELSMSSVSIGMARRVVRRLSMAQAEELARKALLCRDHVSVLAMADEMLHRIAPDVVSLAMKGV